MRIAWLVYLVAVAASCREVLGIDSPPTDTETVCGPYDDPVMLALPAQLPSPIDFSTNAAETHALVRSGTTLTALLDSGGTWTVDPDPMRQMFPAALSSIHLGASENVAFASVMQDGALVVVELHLEETAQRAWSTVTTVTAPDPVFDALPGSEVDLGPNGFHFESITKYRRSGGEAEIVLDRATPADYLLWMEDQPLAGVADPLGGVQAQQGLLLIYSAVTANGDADLFVSSRPDRTSAFSAGRPFAGTINSAMDELEPWVNDDCSNLYFRRRASASSTDPGTIFVAHQHVN